MRKDISFNFHQKRVLVTGAGRGLGKGFALGFAEAGARITVADIDHASAEQTCREIEESGGTAQFFCGDLSDPAVPEQMTAHAVDAWGGLDFAVNNAGCAVPIMNAEDVSPEQWRKVFDLNLQGVFHCAQAEARVMKKGGFGKIVNVSSICGYIVWPEYQAVYSASKAGLIHLTRCLAAEWISHGVWVNSISPGVTRTPELFEEVVPVFLRKAPIGRTAQVDDMTQAVMFLCSSASDFIVGHDLVIDGGYTLT